LKNLEDFDQILIFHWTLKNLLENECRDYRTRKLRGKKSVLFLCVNSSVSVEVIFVEDLLNSGPPLRRYLYRLEWGLTWTWQGFLLFFDKQPFRIRDISVWREQDQKLP